MILSYKLGQIIDPSLSGLDHQQNLSVFIDFTFPRVDGRDLWDDVDTSG